jgi:outer membrane protein assembly factor BamE
MQIPLSRAHRLPCLMAALCLLVGCAAKNPLIDEPAPVAAAPAAQETQEKMQQPQQAAAEQPAAVAAASSVHTSEPSGFRRFLGIFSPYRVDVQQGNFISREMVTQLKEGMQRPEGVSREQARFVMGTPLLIDIFHADRWDYVFRLKKANGELIASNVTLFFDGNRLARIEGGDLPTEQEYLALIAGTKPAAPAKTEPAK